MKKIVILFISVFISALNMMSVAEIVSITVAKETADNFLSLDDEWHHKTDGDVQLIEKDGVPAYYIVEYEAGGWAVVSAHTSSSPVIGYNTTGDFAAPAPMQELLDFNAKIITARAKDVDLEKHKNWENIRLRKTVADGSANMTPDVVPLITINLNQSFPFNMYCPSVDLFGSVTGCVAVGMVQAMMVQNYPPRPYGSHSYICPNTGIQSIDYDAEPAYDWDAINASEETEDYSEIARLLYHAGVSVDMQYGLWSGSGANTELVADALIHNFGYDKKSVYYTSKCPDDDEWLQLILNELVHGRAVVYSGASEIVGHCWNIDGWKQSTQMVHCNWGWGGYGNGYFDLNNMTDSYQGVSFLYDHAAILGVVAPSVAPYDVILSNTQYAIGTEAYTVLSYVETVSTDSSAIFNYELFGPNGAVSPYRVEGNKLISTETIIDDEKFKYLRVKVTHVATGEFYEKEFSPRIVPSNTHKLLGVYSAHANSKFDGYPDQEWNVTIAADKTEPNKVWLRPICMFSSLLPESITPVYAIYNEADSTLTMPLGQVLFESSKYKMVTGITRNEEDIETTGDITLRISQCDTGLKISFASDYVFGVGNVMRNKWWYQALYNISFTQKPQPITAPYGVELSKTIFAIGTVANTKLADITVECDDRTATFSYELYDRQGNVSPYKVDANTLVSSEAIADNESFKFLRIKAINTLTGESCETEFEVQIIENNSTKLEGVYNAYAQSAIEGNPDEVWQVSITVDESNPGKVWIRPILLFADFEGDSVAPIYALYDATTETLSMPLGQIVYEEPDNYQFIIGATSNGQKIITTGSIDMQIVQNDSEIEIVFSPYYILGVGNAIGNKWWYQAIHSMKYSRKTSPEMEVDGIYYNITSAEEKTAEVTYKGDLFYQYENEYSGTVVIPSTVTLNDAMYSVVSIDDFAFARCAELNEVVLPETIASIGKCALTSCDALRTIRVDAFEPPVVYEKTFEGVDKSIALVVPIGCVEAYKDAEYWNEFINIQDITGIEKATSEERIDIYANNGKLVIVGVADNAMVNIYSISGTLLNSVSACNSADIVLPRGVYFVQVEGIVRKIVM